MLEIYLITLAGVSMGQAAPGPNLLAVAGAALGQGRKPAIFTALGVAMLGEDDFLDNADFLFYVGNVFF